MKIIKRIMCISVGFLASSSSFAVVSGGALGTGSTAAASATTSGAVGNLAAIWDGIMTSYAWLIWGVALLWAAYNFMFGEHKNAWKPIAGAAFLYLIGVILKMSTGVVA